MVFFFRNSEFYYNFALEKYAHVAQFKANDKCVSNNKLWIIYQNKQNWIYAICVWHASGRKIHIANGVRLVL